MSKDDSGKSISSRKKSRRRPAAEPRRDKKASGPSHYTKTNTQELSVDEGDIVKTDGNYIYLLHGQELEVIHAWPASELAMSASVAIEGQPQEMFLRNDKLVVYSSIWDTYELYTDAGVSVADDYYSPGLTKVTVLSVSGGSAAVESETYLEGSYTSSRRPKYP